MVLPDGMEEGGGSRWGRCPSASLSMRPAGRYGLVAGGYWGEAVGLFVYNWRANDLKGGVTAASVLKRAVCGSRIVS